MKVISNLICSLETETNSDKVIGKAFSEDNADGFRKNIHFVKIHEEHENKVILKWKYQKHNAINMKTKNQMQQTQFHKKVKCEEKLHGSTSAQMNPFSKSE